MVAPGPPVTVAEPVAAFESSEPVATKDPVTVETAGEATQEAPPPTPPPPPRPGGAHRRCSRRSPR
jgi:hypothetical protein